MQLSVTPDIQAELGADHELAVEYQAELQRERGRRGAHERDASRYSGVCYGGYRPAEFVPRTGREMLAAAREQIALRKVYVCSPRGRLNTALLSAEDSRDAIGALLDQTRLINSRGLTGEAESARSALAAVLVHARRLTVAAEIGLRAVEAAETKAVAA